MSTKEEKSRVRREVLLQTRLQDKTIKAEEDRKIIEFLFNTVEYGTAKTIFAYVGTETEIDTVPLLKAAIKDGKLLFVPLCIGEGEMALKRITSLSELHAGFHGIMEPDADAPEILPDELDLAIIPCVSCAQDGRRLGYGGGFYDRFLAQYKGLSIMLCRTAHMREDIPTDRYDINVHTIITEKGIINN